MISEVPIHVKMATARICAHTHGVKNVKYDELLDGAWSVCFELEPNFTIDEEFMLGAGYYNDTISGVGDSFMVHIPKPEVNPYYEHMSNFMQGVYYMALILLNLLVIFYFRVLHDENRDMVTNIDYILLTYVIASINVAFGNLNVIVPHVVVSSALLISILYLAGV